MPAFAIDVLSLPERAAPSSLANAGKVYSKDVAGVTQLFFMDSAGVEYQLTPFSNTSNGGPIIWGASSSTTTTAARYLRANGLNSTTGTNTLDRIVLPRAGTIRRLYVRHGTVGIGGSVTYTLMKGGVATALEVTLNASDVAGNDLVNTVSVVAGDTLAMRQTKAAAITSSPTQITIAAEYGA